MVFGLRTSRSPIGLDIGSRRIKAVQLSRVPSTNEAQAARPRIEAAASMQREAGDAMLSAKEAHRLMEVLERRGFVGRQLVVAVPGEAVLTSLLELPPRDSQAPLETIAAAEMARTHRVEPGTLEVAFWDLPRPGSGSPKRSGTMVMAAGCRHEHAEALLDALEAAGAEVTALDIPGCALSRAAQPTFNAERPLTAIVDIGWRGVNFVLLHGSCVVYERMLGGIGLEALCEAIRREQPLDQPVIDYLLDAVGLVGERSGAPAADVRLAEKLRPAMEDHFDSLAQELRLSVGYATHEYPDATLSTLLISGGGGMIRGLAEHLSSQLELEVAVMTPQMNCESASDGDATLRQSELNVALGLALYPEKEAA